MTALLLNTQRSQRTQDEIFAVIFIIFLLLLVEVDKLSTGKEIEQRGEVGDALIRC